MGSWVHGFIGSYVHGFIGSWVNGFMGSWVHGCMGSNENGNHAKTMCSFSFVVPLDSVHVFMGSWVSWVHGFMGSWVHCHGFMGSWFYVRSTDLGPQQPLTDHGNNIYRQAVLGNIHTYMHACIHTHIRAL